MTETTQGSSGADRALFRAFGRLEHLPHLPLAIAPTPLQELDLSREITGFRGRLLVKREDLSGAELGGNKVRKLEWLLGAALARGNRTVLTSGGIGSNHALATSLHATQHGLDVHLVIFPHHVSPTSRRTLRAICALGPRVTVARSDKLVPVAMALAWARLRAAGRSPALVLPGGSQPTGTVGAVDLGLELAEQLQTGDGGPPAAVVVPCSSGGTAAGLAVGLSAGGATCPVLAVRVYPQPFTSSTWLRLLARRTVTRLGVDLPPSDIRLRMVDGYLGAGYAEPTEAGAAAREVAAGMGLELESTYSAKAFAALLDLAASPRGQDATLVFVLTYDARIPVGLDDVSADVVPAALRRYA